MDLKFTQEELDFQSEYHPYKDRYLLVICYLLFLKHFRQFQIFSLFNLGVFSYFLLLVCCLFRYF